MVCAVVAPATPAETAMSKRMILAAALLIMMTAALFPTQTETTLRIVTSPISQVSPFLIAPIFIVEKAVTNANKNYTCEDIGRGHYSSRYNIQIQKNTLL
jgi:hypothetical protein